MAFSWEAQLLPPQGGNEGTTFLGDLSSYSLLVCVFLPLAKPNLNPDSTKNLGNEAWSMGGE